MLEIKGIEKSFGQRKVLRDVSFKLNDGELLGLVGPSGVGKSVLLKILCGVRSPDRGSITYTSETHNNKDLSVGYLFQEGALFDSLTVLENVAFPLEVSADFKNGSKHASPRIGREQAAIRAYAILKQVGLSDAYLKMPGQLSGGMRRRVGIARALVGNPDLVLLDDPTEGLDPVAASVIINLIKKLHSEFRPMILLVSHDIRRLLPNVDRVLCLLDGSVRCDSPPSKIQKEDDPEVFKFLSTRFDFATFGMNKD